MKKTLALLLLLAGLSVEAQEKTLTWTGAKSYDWNSWDANWLDEDGKGAGEAEILTLRELRFLEKDGNTVSREQYANLITNK